MAKDRYSSMDRIMHDVELKLHNGVNYFISDKKLFICFKDILVVSKTIHDSSTYNGSITTRIINAIKFKVIGEEMVVSVRISNLKRFAFIESNGLKNIFLHGPRDTIDKRNEAIHIILKMEKYLNIKSNTGKVTDISKMLIKSVKSDSDIFNRISNSVKKSVALISEIENTVKLSDIAKRGIFGSVFKELGLENISGAFFIDQEGEIINEGSTLSGTNIK